MTILNAVFKAAWPYQKDKMNLPVANVELAIPFYEKIMGFRLVSGMIRPANRLFLAGMISRSV